MTNSWTDIANSTFVVVWGANPAENHPACMAHINRARYPKDFFNETGTYPRQDKTPAKLWVVGPRKTRTAVVADRHIRIRPGTDIALMNGVMRYVIDQMETGALGSQTSLDGANTIKKRFFDYLNQSGSGTFFTDGAVGAASTNTQPVPGSSQKTDARFILSGDDYKRNRVEWNGTSWVINNAATPSATTISDFPEKAATCDALDSSGNPVDTVYNRLKAHLAPYTPAVVKDICGLTSEQELFDLAEMMVLNSRCNSDGAVNGGSVDARMPGYRATTLLYAMGITQHTCGAQNVKGFANLQVLLGNVGRAGGGINALRGIHNVQGSTDMGLLYGNIPGYSGNPGAGVTFGQYMDGLWGNPLSGTGGRTSMNQSYDDAYNTAPMNLQQRGFLNMTMAFFGDYSIATTGGNQLANKAKIDAAYSLWPKGNGDNHIKMFRKMISGDTKALVAWGQNPAVTEPNQSKIRDAMENLDLLIVTDLFETETAKVDRKSSGLTFLFPSCSHVEKAGSATNSGRVLQWRYQARPPAGNSKDDTELLMLLASALDTAGAFSHIKTVWDSAGISYDTSVYKTLYQNQYYGTTAATMADATVTDADMCVNRTSLSTAEEDATYLTGQTVTGSEAVAEKIYRQFTAPVAVGGTIWIYTGGYNATGTYATDNRPAGYRNWVVKNRAKSRDLQDAGQLGYHKWGYSWLVNRRVLYNNGEVPGDVADFFMSPDSVARIWAPKAMPTTLYGAGAVNVPVFNYSRWYRTHSAPTGHTMSDRPLTSTGAAPSAHVYPGRFPSHTEPYESPRPDLDGRFGYNTSTANNFDRANGVAFNLVYSDTAVGTKDDYPLVLTTIRCVEHFQGGPTTRNNPLNVEIEPEPWIEIHSADARAYGIKDGDWVNVITARSNSTSDQLGRTPNWDSTPSETAVNTNNFGKGFKARVGVGADTNQRVGRGVVAIPWHWGDAGLSTGSRANDLCIDAGDANTTIPESKACLCKIELA